MDLSIQQGLYEEYEPLADYQNYSAQLSTTGEGAYARYTKAFTAATNYDVGTYNATVSFNYTCYRGPGLEPIEGYVNETKELSLVDSDKKDDVPETPDEIGEAETDQAIPEDYTDEAPVEANSTNYTDDAPFEANQTTSGDDERFPGETPSNFIEVQPLNRTNIVERGRDNSVGFRTENFGDISVGDINIQPELEQLEGWESDGAQIENLTAGDSVNRTLNIRPPSDAELGTRTIPVIANSSGRTVDIDYFYADVVETELNQSVDIVEAPPAVNVEKGETREIPVLIENTGEVELTQIEAEMENHEDCLTYESSAIDSLAVNQTTDVPLTVTAESVGECGANLVLSSDQDAVDFADINLSVNPEDVLIPERHGPPLLAIVLTLVLALYAAIRKKMDWESMTAEIPLILLVMAETLMVIYLSVSYFAFIQLPFLPF